MIDTDANDGQVLLTSSLSNGTGRLNFGSRPAKFSSC